MLGDNNSENIEDSIGQDENGIYPLVNLNISLNNGQKKSLEIYENDNAKRKVKEFCFTNRISPSDEEVLLQRVKEELGTKSTNSKNRTRNDNLSSDRNIEQPKKTKQINNNFLDYIPKEQKRLDQILNESDSISVSQSLKQSTNNLDDLIKDFKSDDDAEMENTYEQKNIIGKKIKTKTIKNNFKESVNPNINSNIQPTLLSNDNLMNSINTHNNLKNITKPTIIKSDYNNLNNNIEMKVIPNKEINRNNSSDKNNNQILFNNSRLNKPQVSNTYQNGNNIPLNNSNYSQENINPYTSLINQKVEFIDTFNNNINNNKPKAIIYNTIQNGNYVNYNQIENPNINNSNKVIFQNNKEPYNYNYSAKTFSSNKSNPNIYNQRNIMNKNESIVYNNNQGQYTNLNNINSNYIITDINNPQNISINYNNLINKKDINYNFAKKQNTQSDRYDIVNQTEYSTIENRNLRAYNGNFDRANSQKLKYNNNAILKSPILDNNLNLQKANHEIGPNIFSNQNSQYHIYENIQSPKSLKSYNYINDLNNQKEEKQHYKAQKVKVLKLENFDYNLTQNKSNKLTDIGHINNNKVQNMNYSNKNLNMNENPNLNKNTNMNTNLINNSQFTTLNDNLNKNSNLNNNLTKDIKHLNDIKRNAIINHKNNNNLKSIEIPMNKNNNNGMIESNKKKLILSNKEEERKINNKGINTTIKIESNYNKENNIYDRNMIKKDINNEMRERNIEIINNISNKDNSIKSDEKGEGNIEEKEPQDNYKKKKRSDLPRDADENQTLSQCDNISVISKHNITNLTNHEINISKINISEINNSKNSISNNNINESKINNSINNNKSKPKIIEKGNNFDNLNEINRKEMESNKKVKNFININEGNSSYNHSESKNEDSIGNINFENYLDKELNNKKPKYIKIINLENSDYSSQSQLFQNSQIKKYTKNTNQQKNINNKNKPMKILTFKKNEFNSNNINKRSNSSGANKNRSNFSRNNFSGERLYQQYKIQLQRKEELKKRILKERSYEGNRKISPSPRIDPNSRRIVEKMRNNKYGYYYRQKPLIEKENNDIKNKIKRPSKYKIDKKSSSIDSKNKKDRVCKSIDIIEEKKRRIKYKKIDLNKEFGKRNRSIGNEHSKRDDFINFEIQKNNNNSYLSRNNKNIFKKNSNATNENNYNLNSYRNSKYEDNILIEENKPTLSQLDKTLELNEAYKELYNSIDEKNDSDITKYFGNYGADLNSNLTENNIYSHNKINSRGNKHSSDKRPLTPPVYNNFDYLYYESEKQDEEKRKKQENQTNKNYPLDPRISPKSKINRSNRSNFQPKIYRGPKNQIKREKTYNLDRLYDERITKDRNELQKIKNEENKENNNLYGKKNKDNIMKIKTQKYKELFNLMDSNKDGFISSSEIKLTKIDKGLLKNISPLLEELNQTKKRMNFKEFCIKIDKLMIDDKLQKK